MEHNKLIFSKVPTLRFKKYDTNWDRKKLSDYVKKITRKNSNNVIKNVICNSAQNGLIPQLDFFDKEIANDENTVGYYIINNGDFVYNPRKSLNAPYGPVNMYKYEKAGIVSPLYLCFSVDESINKSFLLQRFKSPCWYRYIYLNGDSGARHDRVSIKDDVFLSQPISLPSAEEQTDIAVFLEKIDERIEIQNKIISKYETLIKGLSYYIIKKFNGKEYKLGTLAEIYQPQTITKTDLPDNGKYPVYGANGIIGYYNRFNHKESQIMITCRGSTCGTVNLSTPYSWITGNSMVINIDEHKSTVDKKYLYYYLKTQSFNDLISGSGQPQIVRKPLVNLNVFLPEISQQIKLGEIIDIFEKTLKNEKEMLSALQKQKAFLLQSMFI